MITIRSNPSLHRMKDKMVTKSMFGINFAFEDLLIPSLNYKKNLNIDSNFKVPLKDTPFETSRIKIMLDHDFTEKYFEIFYFGYMDILASIGGINASIKPLIGIVGPIFILNFMYQLAKIIHEKYEDQYHEELVKLHNDYRVLYEKIDI